MGAGDQGGQYQGHRMSEIKVLSSQAIKEAYLAFAPEFERVSGHKLNTTWNGTVDILKKLRAGEAFDMVILVTPSMDEMIKEGKIVADSRVDLVRSGIAIAVPPGRAQARHQLDRHGQARAARREERRRLFVRTERRVPARPVQALGHRRPDQDRNRRRPGTPVGTLLARGDVDIGFQQVSELLLYPGHPICRAAADRTCSTITVFAGGVHTAAKHPEAARELIQFITSPAALPYIKQYRHGARRTMIDRRRLLATSAAAALRSGRHRPRAGARPGRTASCALIVPIAPGGPTDVAARVMAEPLSRLWGQQVVVENKPGGGTNIGSELVAKSSSRRPYDPLRHVLAGGCAQSLPHARLRSGRRPCAGREPLQLPVLHVRAEHLAGKDGAGIHRPCQRPIRASSRWRRPAPAARRISPPSCSRPWPASR